MYFEKLLDDPHFRTGLFLINSMEDKKFVKLLDRMMKDFDPNRIHFFTNTEMESLEKSLKISGDQVQCLLCCLNNLLKQIISNVIKPVELKYLLINLLSIELNKVDKFCACWTVNAKEIVTRLQQNYMRTLRLLDVNWALNISSSIKDGLTEPEPKALIEFKIEDNQSADDQKVKHIYFDLDIEELKQFSSTLEKIKQQLEKNS
ncbi:COMM domain-containing protein 10-like [Daktulosphaira vitifoliae]|uniref:COMM domain-containing protein 10-like n=1 Tax=Daktulosphaira vitifoliae TaxID=58002 RepID=UPI0021AA2636|nr:COMM domain-containing protein 10-like [Daktulosphaira vitifoliae]